MIALIARSENGVIGKDGKLPWHCSEDLKFFKRMTQGKALLMGSTTYVGMPLIKGRPIYVRTSRFPEELLNKVEENRKKGQEVHLVLSGPYLSIHKDIDVYSYMDSNHVPWKDIVLCGGARTYSSDIWGCSEIYVSVIKGDYEGDTYFDESWLERYQLAGNMKVSDELSIQKYVSIYLKNSPQTI